MPQEDINAVLVFPAHWPASGVVRLKGGDPFVFGRGMEEVLGPARPPASWSRWSPASPARWACPVSPASPSPTGG